MINNIANYVGEFILIFSQIDVREQFFVFIPNTVEEQILIFFVFFVHSISSKLLTIDERSDNDIFQKNFTSFGLKIIISKEIILLQNINTLIPYQSAIKQVEFVLLHLM